MRGFAHYDIIYLQIMMTVQVWKYIPLAPKINMRSDIVHIINSEFLRLPHINIVIIKVTRHCLQIFLGFGSKEIEDPYIYIITHLTHLCYHCGTFYIRYNDNPAKIMGGKK